MHLVKRAAVVLGVGVLLVGGWTLWFLYGPVPIPDGYHFPRHSIFGGPTALFDGRLVEEAGCVRTADGFAVIWPPGYRFDLEDGELVIRGGGRTVPLGERVRMGGGYYEDGLPQALAAAADAGCPGPFFLTTGWA